jgi:hypothetical protein
MNRAISLALTVAALAASSTASAPAFAGGGHGEGRRSTDFALFDGTNPANTEPGVVCFAERRRPGPWVLHVGVSSFGGTEFRAIYRDGDFVRYQVPTGTSFSLSEAAGRNQDNVAIRIDNTNDAGPSGLAGSVSAEGLNGIKVTCISCDNDADGPALCDQIVPN